MSMIDQSTLDSIDSQKEKGRRHTSMRAVPAMTFSSEKSVQDLDKRT